MHQLEAQLWVGVMLLGRVTGDFERRRADVAEAALRRQFVAVHQVAGLLGQAHKDRPRVGVALGRGGRRRRRRFTVEQPHDGCYQRIGHAPLGHEGLGAGLQRGSKIAAFAHQGKNDNFDPRQQLFELRHQLHPRLVAQVQVQQDHIGLDLGRPLEGRLRLVRSAHDFQRWLKPQVVAGDIQKKWAVIYQKNTDGPVHRDS